MDEIDAALDKKNSKKLSDLLKDYADGNQFIVISHNKNHGKTRRKSIWSINAQRRLSNEKHRTRGLEPPQLLNTGKPNFWVYGDYKREKFLRDEQIMDNYEIDNLAEMPWEETLEFLTADMDPENIDICILTERYQEYIEDLEEFDLEVPARAIRLCAALLRIKTLALAGEPINEEEVEDPMEFEGEAMMEEDFVEDDEPDLKVGPDLEIPVKAKPRRRISLDELTAALGRRYGS